MDRKTALVFLFAIVLGLFMRSGHLLYWNHPYADSESQLTILPMEQVISGATPVFLEKAPISLIGVFSYELLHPIGLSLYQSLFVLQGLFIVFAFILVYSITFKLSNENTALYACLLFAVMPTAVLSQNIGNYVGDSFEAVFVLLAVYLLVIAFKRGSVLLFLVSLIIAFICSQFWNGGLFVLSAWGIGVIGICALYLTSKRKALLIIGLLMLFLWILYSHSSLYVGPALSNDNAVSLSQVYSLNLQTLISQQNVNRLMPIGDLDSFLLGSALFALPLIFLLFLGWQKQFPFIMGLMAIAITGLPEAVIDARFESLIVMPIVILASLGSTYIRIPHKKLVYSLFLFLLVIFVIGEIWLTPVLWY